MNLKDFYDFSSKFLSSTVRVRSIGLNPGDRDTDIGDANRLLLGEYTSIKFPIVFRQDKGTRLQDVLDTGRAFLFLISERMKTALQENNLTGWKSFPVHLIDKDDGEIEGYHGLSITGRCGPIDFSKSEVIYKRLVAEGPLCKYYKGRYVGLEDWDGSDFFLPVGSYGTVITSKVADVVRSSNLTNVQLRSLADIEIPEEAAT